VVGRFGGDEFIIFIKDTDDIEYAKKISLEIADGISESVKLPDEKELVTVSIGVAMYHGQEHHYSDLFKRADIALYKTKANRANKFTINE
jgi:diguanylate cyclase (GGDEF)-like protein